MTSCGRKFEFHDAIYIIGIVTLTIDGVLSFLQPLDAQNVRKNTCFILNKSCGKFWQFVQDGGIVIDYEVF